MVVKMVFILFVIGRWRWLDYSLVTAGRMTERRTVYRKNNIKFLKTIEHFEIA